MKGTPPFIKEHCQGYEEKKNIAVSLHSKYVAMVITKKGFWN